MKSNYWRLTTSGMIILVAVLSLQKSMAQTTVNISAPQAPELIADAGEDATINVGEDITIGGSPAATGGSGNYSYLWNRKSYLDYEFIANPVATPTGNMTFTLTVTDDEGCTASDEIYIAVTGGSGISNSETDINLNIYPNPGSGTFTIAIENLLNERQLKITITGLSGQKVYEDICEIALHLEKEIDLSNLSKGCYILTISGESTHIERQLILQ